MLVTEVYVQLGSNLLIPKRSLPDAPPRVDPLIQVIQETEDLGEVVNNNFSQEITRDTFPTIPIETLVLTNHSITKRQLERLKEIRKASTNSDVQAGLGGLMTQMIHQRDERAIALLGEIDYDSDEELISQQFPEEDEKPAKKSPIGFDTPQPSVCTTSENETLLPVAQE